MFFYFYVKNRWHCNETPPQYFISVCRFNLKMGLFFSILTVVTEQRSVAQKEAAANVNVRSRLYPKNLFQFLHFVNFHRAYIAIRVTNFDDISTCRQVFCIDLITHLVTFKTLCLDKATNVVIHFNNTLCIVCI